MLIHFSKDPIKEHPDVNVTFRVSVYKHIIFSKTSGIFAWYEKHELKRFAQKLWPNFDLQFIDATYDQCEVEVNLKNWYL